MVASDLKQVGVNVRLNANTNAEIVRRLYQGGWEGAAFVMVTEALPALDALAPFRIYSCEWIAPFHCNEDDMPLIQAARRELDPGTRRNMIRSLLRRFHDDPPVIYLFHLVNFTGLMGHVTGFASDYGIIRYHDLRLSLNWPSHRETVMQHETIRGRILYTSKKPEKMDQVRGGESFIITKHIDGRRTLRAHCAIDEDSPRVLRDSITDLDENWTPLRSFVQTTVDEEFVGSAWYRITETTAECETYTEKEGRVSQRFPLERPPAFFGTHAIQSDAMHTNCYDLSKGPGEQKVAMSLSCSLHHRGATGPILYKRSGLPFTFIGEEDVAVQAGQFKALHFRIGAATDDDYMGTDVHPPYHAWVTADGDYVLLKAHCTGYMQTFYELTEYERRKNFF